MINKQTPPPCPFTSFYWYLNIRRLFCGKSITYTVTHTHSICAHTHTRTCYSVYLDAFFLPLIQPPLTWECDMDSWLRLFVDFNENRFSALLLLLPVLLLLWLLLLLLLLAMTTFCVCIIWTAAREREGEIEWKIWSAMQNNSCLQ